MGVFSKLKGIFYDEIVIEDKDEELEKVDKIVKKESQEIKPKVEKINFAPIEETSIKEEPIKENKQENTFSERELFRSERTFNFTEFDDDEDEKLPPRKNILDIENNSRNSRVNDIKPQVTEPKVFKPSPIISPIYGILDKDYKKEEIKEKTIVRETASDITKSKITTYDTVRRKAYGTLEDDLEDTLNTVNSITTSQIKEEVYKKANEENQSETKKSKIKDLISKIEDVSDEIDKIDTSLSIGDLEDSVKLDDFNTEEMVTDKTMTDSTLEHDLFNLIDSMYDDKEE